MDSKAKKIAATKVMNENPKATTSKVPPGAAPKKVLTSRKDGIDVVEIDLSMRTPTDQNGNSGAPGKKYNANSAVTTGGKQQPQSQKNGTENKKAIITSIAVNNNKNIITGNSGITRRNGTSEDTAGKGPQKVIDSSNCVATPQPNPKAWYSMDTHVAKDYQQYHRQIVTQMLQRGYSPAYAEVMATSLLQSRGTNVSNSIGVEIRSAPNRGKPCFWRGELPPRNYCNPVFSSKVFVGGVPWDITETALLQSFSKYGCCRVEWPNKETTQRSRTNSRRTKVTGYVYMIFDSDWAVKKLLQDCSQEYGTAGEWYFKLNVNRDGGLEIRQVQVIPWVITDASYIISPNMPLDPKKTVFVGALHGMITAQVLFSIMRDVYGDVLFVGIDTDRQKYPIGSARVTFSTQSAYFRAIESGYLEIRTSKFTKRIQIDPFLEETKCSQCECVQGPYFCREKCCFKYFCLQCWEVRHSLTGPYGGHKPMIRTRRSLHLKSYITYGTANWPFSYDPRTIPGQYFGRFTSEIGIQMGVRPPGPDRIQEVSKPAGVKLTFGQPTYLLPRYPKQTIQQVQQVWVPPSNQPVVIKQAGSQKPRVDTFLRMPCTSSSSFGSRNGKERSDSLRTENTEGTSSACGATSTSLSVPSSEISSANPSP